MYKLPVLQN